MLYKFIFLVKNLRGVFTPAPGDEYQRYVDWLAKRFRYRDLGVARCTVERNPTVFQRRLEGNPFHVLEYPTQRVREVAHKLLGMFPEEIDRCIVESLLLASTYACPVLTTSNVLNLLSKAGLIVHEVRGPKLGVQDAKLHLRIADYSVLDHYIESVEWSKRLSRRELGPDEYSSMVRDWAQRDAKRYWRFAGKGDNVVIAYIDYTRLLAPHLQDMEVDDEVAVLLATLVAFNLDSVA